MNKHPHFHLHLPDTHRPLPLASAAGLVGLYYYPSTPTRRRLRLTQYRTMSTPASSQTMSATTTESAKPSCVTATPGKYGHVPTDACNSYYNFDPNFPAAIAFTVFFGLATLTHFVQAVVLRKVRPLPLSPSLVICVCVCVFVGGGRGGGIWEWRWMSWTWSGGRGKNYQIALILIMLIVRRSIV